MQATLDPIMPRLKEHTQSLHDETERGSFNRLLMQGELPVEAYTDLLVQLWFIHRALESHLTRLRGVVSSFATVLRDYQFQEPYLREDLTYFGREVATQEALPETTRFVEFIHNTAAEDPVGLLGIHYVFEGSNNGGQYIARAVSAAYQLSNGVGTRYLNPYGEQQRPRWQAFKDDMNCVGFSPLQTRSLLGAASETFRYFMKLHEALHDRHTRALS